MGIVKPLPQVVNHKFHCGEIELIVSRFFNPRQNLIVPNISWGMLSHECDLLVLTQSNYAYEIEIKISASDLKADAKKSHGHRSKQIKLLYFAIPEYLKAYIEFIPERAGIILVERVIDTGRISGQPETGYRDTMKIIRAPHVNKEAEKWDDRKKLELMRLSTMRIWSLKESLYRMAKEKRK